MGEGRRKVIDRGVELEAKREAGDRRRESVYAVVKSSQKKERRGGGKRGGWRGREGRVGYLHGGQKSHQKKEK